MTTEFGSGFGTESDGAVAARRAANAALSDLGDRTADFAIVFCSSTYDLDGVCEGVQAATGEIDLVGATSVGEFTEDGVMTDMSSGETGVTVGLIASDEMAFFTGIGDGADRSIEAAVDDATSSLPQTVDGYAHSTGLIVTSLDWRGEQLLMQTYKQRPIQWIGGGASDEFQDGTAVFTAEEVARSGIALALVASDRPLGTAVGHAHDPIGDGYEVTESDGNVVYELGGEPAYDVWKRSITDTVEEHYDFSVADVEDDPQRLLQLMAEFAFGLKTGDDEYKIRSPGVRPETDGPLHFTEDIPEGVTLYPMASKKAGVVDRARGNIESALADLEDDEVAGAVVFDCICGELVLGEDYDQVVEAIQGKLGTEFTGMMSFGEICLREGDMRGLHNGSLSVLILPE